MPTFQKAKTVRPVIQKATRCSCSVRWAVAIAVDSSITRWAAARRRASEPPMSAGDGEAVDAVASGEDHRPAERRRRAAPGGDDADGAELRRPGEHEQRHRARLDDRPSRRHGADPERRRRTPRPPPRASTTPSRPAGLGGPPRHSGRTGLQLLKRFRRSRMAGNLPKNGKLRAALGCGRCGS